MIPLVKFIFKIISTILWIILFIISGIISIILWNDKIFVETFDLLDHIW